MVCLRLYALIVSSTTDTVQLHLSVFTLQVFADFVKIKMCYIFSAINSIMNSIHGCFCFMWHKQRSINKIFVANVSDLDLNYNVIF